MAIPAVQSTGATGNADPELGTITADENPGNGNGIIERGEGARLLIQLKNTGGVKAATAVTATLTSSTPGVIVTLPGISPYADMAVGAVGGNNLSRYTFTLDPAYPCGQTADFTLTVNFAGGSKALHFTVETGLLSITNTLGTLPPASRDIVTATGTQEGYIARNGVTSACGSPKAFTGALPGSHTFDSYTFTACRSFCMQPVLKAGAAGINLFESVYSPSYDPNNIETNYAGDAGMSTNIQSLGINTAAATPYTIVINDVGGNPLPPPAPPNTYTIKIPSCAFNCDLNQLPVARARNASVIAANTGGTAEANVNNGSFDPDGDTITLAQTPPSPYPVGDTNVILSVTDVQGATAQANATVTVRNPGFSIALTKPSLVVTRGQPGTAEVMFTPDPGIGAPLTFTCVGMPLGARCAFSPSSLPVGSPATNVSLTVTSGFAALTHSRVPYATCFPLAGMCLIGMLVMTPKKRRKTSMRVVAPLLLGALGLLAGCGGSTANQPVGPLNVTVSATSGNVTQTAAFQLTVNP